MKAYLFPCFISLAALFFAALGDQSSTFWTIAFLLLLAFLMLALILVFVITKQKK